MLSVRAGEIAEPLQPLQRDDDAAAAAAASRWRHRVRLQCVAHQRALGVAALVLLLSVLLVQLYLHFYAHWCLMRATTLDEPDARVALFADPQIEGLYREFVEGWWGVWNNRLNDMFQHHVYRSMMRASGARYGVVLGDLFSFQHLPIEEFLWRADRFNWIFSPYPDEGLIIVAGNHDIGYGSDMTQHLVDRWESEFGDVNAFYRIADHPVAVLNSMALDATRDYSVFNRTMEHVYPLLNDPRHFAQPLILFQHIPLHKEAGICVDSPSIVYDEDGYVLEQTMLSPEWTRSIVERIKPKLVINGHDHHGCFYQHNNDTAEYTIRSMMGDFDGHAAILELRRRPNVTERHTGRPVFEYNVVSCSFITMRNALILWIYCIVTTLVLVLGVALWYWVIVRSAQKQKLT